MSTHGWLLLTDYSSKYRVSVSTLRRRIKTGQQKHRFEGGKYYLPDEAAMVQDAAIQKTEAPPNAARERTDLIGGETAATPSARAEEPLLTTTTRLLNELKQAYTLILQEREEQILHLKAEIADLKTLIRALESENTRLRSPRPERVVGHA